MTSEAFGEIEIPLIHDTPLIRSLDFSGAARLTNVTATRQSDGFTSKDRGNWTYKLGLNWEVTHWLRFRGTYGTSYRSPALFEEFLADESSFPQQTQIDPCIRYGTKLGAGPGHAAPCRQLRRGRRPRQFVGGTDSANRSRPAASVCSSRKRRRPRP